MHKPRRETTALLRSDRNWLDAGISARLRLFLPAAANLAKGRWAEVSEKSSFYIRLVGGAHKPDDDALYPGGTKLSRVRALQYFAPTFTDWIEIGFRILGFH